MTITTTFDPPLPSDSPAVFNAKAFTLLGDLNTWGDEANDLQADVNAKQATASAAATTATTQAGLATAAKNAAESAWDNFDDRYLGPKASNPTLDNDGNALLEGALYWNTAAKEMRTWNGTAWVTTSVANALSRTGDTMTGTLNVGSGGSVLVTGSGGIGYGVGSGGTVVQATSKSTAVTLNKPSGQITMNNAALAAGATVAFQLANSLLATSDGIVIACIGGVSSLANYRLSYGVTAAGIASIYVTNQTGGSLSEAIVLNFQKINGATS